MREINIESVDFIKNNNNDESNVLLEKPFKILIADDDEDIHKITEMVLRDFIFDSRKLEFYNTYTGKETIQFMKKNKDIAVILLDVVMEDFDSGLRVVKFIREESKNKLVRIILRTGQPGIAPEKQVVIEYDINDYKNKSELTVEKLFTVMYSSLRSYRDLKRIEKSKKGLELTVSALKDLYNCDSFMDYLNGVITQISALYNFQSEALLIETSSNEINGIVALENCEDDLVIAATGKFNNIVGKGVSELNIESKIAHILNKVRNSSEKKQYFHIDDLLVFYKKIDTVENYIILEVKNNFNLDLRILNLYLNNFYKSVENYILYNRIISRQKSFVSILADVIENRSNIVSNHIERVQKVSRLLCEKLGFTKNSQELIEIASSLHDLGKIGISENILLKPDKLSEFEYKIARQHSRIGYEILNKEKTNELMYVAAEIALHHHENYDGTGYPDKLKGEEIPISARIVAVADVFDSIISKSIYKNPCSFEGGVQYIKDQKNKKFDPLIVDIFMENIDSIMKLYTKKN